MTGRLKSILYGCAPLALALAAMLTATPAAAQIEDATRAQKARTPNQGAGPAPLAPPAVPGASSQQGLAIPASRPVSDMSPNDALFDAINRGDVGDARDAITRGADLSARNVLGLTPIDLSVDLSRNDITFLLLSFRGTPSAGRGPMPALAVAGAGAVTPVKAQLPVATRPAAALPDPAPKRQLVVSTDPGTPAPQVGFLGFGGVPQQ